ncbi:MAG: hypothetical protein ABI667_04285 [Sphingomicrobium sp.]
MGQTKQRTKLLGGLVVAVIGFGIAFHVFVRFWWELDPPERGIMANADLPIEVDTDCVERSLRKRFPDLTVYNGHAGEVPEGRFQSIFDYYGSRDGRGRAVLTFIDLQDRMRTEHFFIGHYEEIPQEDFPPALQAMKRASDALHDDCDIDLSALKFREVGQRVAALHQTHL